MEVTTNFNQIYRGTVKDNTGVRGRCKIFVPGVYPKVFENDPQALPWAQPAMSLVGGNFTAVNADAEMDNNSSTSAPLCINETGFCGPPHIGAEIWVFFEQGNHTFPIYFAAAQAGEGWFSEHPLQHVFKSDNVRVRIDEAPERADSTTKFDTYNQNNTFTSQALAKSQVPTRVDIEVFGNVNIHVRGNVNMKVEGDVFEEVVGNKHETLIGNLYKKHVGDIHYVHQGNELYEHNGDYVEITRGTKAITHEGDKTEFISATRSTVINSIDTLTVGELRDENHGARNQTITGNDEVQINGNRDVKVKGSDSLAVAAAKTITSARMTLVGASQILFKCARGVWNTSKIDSGSIWPPKPH